MVTELHTEDKRELFESDEFLQDWDFPAARHLNDAQAIERFRKEEALHPDALVLLEDLDCGHWEVSVYATEEEKEEFIRNKWSDFLSQFKTYLKRLRHSEISK